MTAAFIVRHEHGTRAPRGPYSSAPLPNRVSFSLFKAKRYQLEGPACRESRNLRANISSSQAWFCVYASTIPWGRQHLILGLYPEVLRGPVQSEGIWRMPVGKADQQIS